jgi:predicted DNA-binding transcriptional regulator AlpA
MRQIVISKTELAEKYETMSTKEVAGYYGLCLATLYRLLDKSGIPRKCPGKTRKEKTVIKLED